MKQLNFQNNLKKNGVLRQQQLWQPHQLQALEQRHRRVRLRHWGPRTLDLDLLWMDAAEWHHPRLTLPHPELANRAFVVLPLTEVATDLRLPDGQTLASLADHWNGALTSGDLSALNATEADR